MAAANAPSYKSFQDTWAAMYRGMSPLFLYMRNRRLTAPQDKRAAQQAQNLKWQQEAFHRILQLVGRVREGLATEEDLIFARQELLDSIVAHHPDGEWPEFTRDKLLFLQDLFHTACLTETQYHKAKRELMVRLADQDAEISAQDFDFRVTSPGMKRKRMPVTSVEARTGEDGGEQVGDSSPTCKNAASPHLSKKSPLKHLTSRIKKGLTFKDSDGGGGSKTKLRVPHALDFLRPEGCPTRHPPVAPSVLKATGGPTDSPLFHAPDVPAPAPSMESSSQAAEPKNGPPTPSSRPVAEASPVVVASSPAADKSASHKAHGRSPAALVSGFMRKLHGDSDGKAQENAVAPVVEEAGEEEQQQKPAQQEVPAGPKRLWRLDALRTPKKILGALGVVEDDSNTDKRDDEDVEEEDKPLLDENLYREPPKGQGPDPVNIKQKIHKQGAATDFFIDKVLGDNIKAELARIRSELQQSHPGQTFTNEQIDAIATRLPVDKSELMRFFPKSWCDRYGDIVLEVVHKEFKDHVAEMGNQKKANSAKRVPASDGKVEQSRSSPMAQGGKENRQGAVHRTTKVNIKGFATTEASPASQKKAGSGLDEASNMMPNRAAARTPSHGLGLEDDLDGKLVAEIQRLPTRRHGEAKPMRI